MLSKLSSLSLKLAGMTCKQLCTAGHKLRRDRLCRRMAARWCSATRDVCTIWASTYFDLYVQVASPPSLPHCHWDVLLSMAARFRTSRSADVWRMPTSRKGILAGYFAWHLYTGVFDGARWQRLADKMKGLLWDALQTTGSTRDDASHEIMKRWAAFDTESQYAGRHDAVPEKVIEQCSQLMGLLLDAKFCLPLELIGACSAIWQASLCYLAI